MQRFSMEISLIRNKCKTFVPEKQIKKKNKKKSINKKFGPITTN